MTPQDPWNPRQDQQPQYQGQPQQYPYQQQQYPPPYPSQGQPYYGGQQPGPPPRAPRRRGGAGRKVLIAIGAVFGLIVALGIIGAVAGGGKGAPAAASSSAAATASPAATHATAAAAPVRAASKPTITYVVTGTPGADVTYGPSGSDLAGRVPMRVTKKLGHADYYSIDAQLNGGGKVTVEIIVGGKIISKGTATGGYNIASAEIAQDPFSGKWESMQ